MSFRAPAIQVPGMLDVLEEAVFKANFSEQRGPCEYVTLYHALGITDTRTVLNIFLWKKNIESILLHFYQNLRVL